MRFIFVMAMVFVAGVTYLVSYDDFSGKFFLVGF